jgi:hypothetical protein
MDESRIEEAKSEADEVSPRQDTKSRALKYVVIWVAVVALFLVFNNVIKSVASNQAAAFEPGSCGGGSCGDSCGSSGAQVAPGGSQAASTELAAIEKAAMDYYAERTGDREVTAEAESLGCHYEITIKKDGKAVTELSFRNGEFSGTLFPVRPK